MSFHSTSTTSRSRRLVTPIALATVAVSGIAAITTGAVFNSTATINGNAFTAGTVTLSANPASTVFNAPNMAPGDVITAPITVQNTGSLELRYAMESVTTGNLANALTLAVKTGVTDCTNTGFSATGTSLYAQGALGTAAGSKVFGDKAQGPDTGDRVLAAGTSEVLCLQVTLPATTDNTYQGATGTATFNFYAEQTANNGTDAVAPNTPSGPTAPSGTVTDLADTYGYYGDGMVYDPTDGNIYMPDSDNDLGQFNPTTLSLNEAGLVASGKSADYHVAYDPTRDQFWAIGPGNAGPSTWYGVNGDGTDMPHGDGEYPVDGGSASGYNSMVYVPDTDSYFATVSGGGDLTEIPASKDDKDDPVALDPFGMALDPGSQVAYDSDQKMLYVWNAADGNFYKVNPVTGASTVVGNFGDSVVGMAYDSINKTMYFLGDGLLWNMAQTESSDGNHYLNSGLAFDPATGYFYSYDASAPNKPLVSIVP